MRATGEMKCTSNLFSAKDLGILLLVQLIPLRDKLSRMGGLVS